MLAGVSVTWYTWLEQGRPINASVDVLEALARALRLDDAERRHLLTLAERPGNAGPHEPIIEDAPDALVRLITAMEPSPAYVLGPWFDFLAWNRAESLLYPLIDRLAAARAQPAVGRVRRAVGALADRRLGRAGPSAAGRVPCAHRIDPRRAAGGRAGRAAARRQPDVRRVVGRPGRRRLPDPPAPLPPPQRRRAGLRVPAADAERVARPARRRASCPSPATTAPSASPPGATSPERHVRRRRGLRDARESVHVPASVRLRRTRRAAR